MRGSAVGFCTAPANIQMQREEARTIVLTWDPVEGASYYKIFWDDWQSCTSTFWCDDLIAPELNETTYTHDSADSGWNSYAILACANNVCSARGVVSGTP